MPSLYTKSQQLIWRAGFRKYHLKMPDLQMSRSGFITWQGTRIVAPVMATRWPTPDSKVHGANMGPIWGRQDPGGPHVGPMNFVLWDPILCFSEYDASNDQLGFSVYVSLWYPRQSLWLPDRFHNWCAVWNPCLWTHSPCNPHPKFSWGAPFLTPLLFSGLK